VQLGEQFDDRVVVREGLTAGQQVVASGQFLIDSEASLQGVLARGGDAGAAAPTVHQARGVVVEIGRDKITLDHEPVPALKWPQMTMPFKLADPMLAKGLAAGQRIEFDFKQQGGDAVLVRVAPASGARR
jgi:Cu(I)/Ag(I) efflux system membrane fusion protein